MEQLRERLTLLPRAAVESDKRSPVPLKPCQTKRSRKMGAGTRGQNTMLSESPWPSR